MIPAARYSNVAAAAPNSLLGQATLYFGGNAPSNYIDFTSNRALIAGVDVGAVASIPSITGTLNLSSGGQQIASAANGLFIPLSGLTYPLSFYVEFVRTVDSGVLEVIAVIDEGDATDMVQYRIDTGDQVRFAITTAGVTQCNIGGGTTIPTVPSAVQRAVGRAQTNDAQNCRNGTLGTQDTVVTLPAPLSRLIVGVDSSGVQTFTGFIRRIATFNSALTNAQLQTATTT